MSKVHYTTGYDNGREAAALLLEATARDYMEMSARTGNPGKRELREKAELLNAQAAHIRAGKMYALRATA
jgi:hypothetical protein